jgi:phospholipase C
VHNLRAAVARAVLVALIAPLTASAGGVTLAFDAQIPRYQHVFVIVAENKDFAEVVGSRNAPSLNALASEYGYATHFYAETHPSEPNYVALVGGYTYGIRDDDAFFCTPHMENPSCPHSDAPGYVDHTVDAPNLASQLEAAHLDWKEYLESIPAPGSLVASAGMYAAKHSGFVNFASVQRDPRRAEHLVGFAQFAADLRADRFPALAFVIPNVCDEMHGAPPGPRTPAGCNWNDFGSLVRRGDDRIGSIVHALTSTALWRSSQNVAIVVTFDENGAGTYAGCCGNDPSDPANRGGGRIPTIVITNHGPRHAVDATPYSHYSLLRTIEDAFGVHPYLGRAAAPGVVPMLPLFRVAPAR